MKHTYYAQVSFVSLGFCIYKQRAAASMRMVLTCYVHVHLCKDIQVMQLRVQTGNCVFITSSLHCQADSQLDDLLLLEGDYFVVCRIIAECTLCTAR